MDWHDLSANWDTMMSRLKRRFPGIDQSRFSQPPRDSSALTRHLADMHELTVPEARDALQEFLRVEGLARRAGELASD